MMAVIVFMYVCMYVCTVCVMDMGYLLIVHVLCMYGCIYVRMYVC